MLNRGVGVGFVILVSGCWTPTGEVDHAEATRPIVYAPSGTSSRVGCAQTFARVHTGAVDVCVAMYESPGFGAPPEGLSLREAEQACADLGARLCSEQEWEAACRGPVGSIFPYGETFDPYACVTQAQAPMPSGLRNRCRSGFGVYDMSGNAAEWVDGGMLRGGAYDADAFGARCGAKARFEPSAPPGVTGARCCHDPNEAGQ